MKIPKEKDYLLQSFDLKNNMQEMKNDKLSWSRIPATDDLKQIKHIRWNKYYVRFNFMKRKKMGKEKLYLTWELLKQY